MYAGIDLGTTYIKTHTGLIFPSGISEDVYNMANNVMTIDGKKYTMELFNENAEYEINVNKTLNKNARLNFLYAMHKISNDSEGVYKGVIVGLPASQWKNDNNVNTFKKILNLSDPIDIEVNGMSKTIFAEEIEIVPEGSTAYYAIDYKNFNGRKVLILDWGGLTLNSILFQNDEIIDVYTDEFGSLKIYKNISGEINSQIGTNIKLEDMHDVILNGFPIKDKIQLVKEITQEIVMSYCKQVYKNLKLKWDVETIANIIMIGGSSITLGQYLCKYIPQGIIENDAQILAAKGMGIVARMCFSS
jgi:hypothetical protein